MDILTIGIAGGTGSGKTTLVDRICQRFGAEVCVVRHDNYYRRHDELSYEQRCELNYDHPEAFETDLMIRHLRLLKTGQPVECPVYDFAAYNRTDRTTTLHPKRVIIVEGILIFSDPLLRSEMDIKIFVDTDADVRILRRVTRDVEERGRSVRSVVEQYLATVKPMHELFVEPSKRAADVIILEGAFNEVALDLIMKKIEAHLKK
ncbi:MAG TPA: uridine kinase [Clostridiales bacterium]|nr:uridine kinase [Clostridiales bacterium]